MTPKIQPYFYQPPSKKDNIKLFNRRILMNSNYEYFRFKTTPITNFTPSDLYVSATYLYVCAPIKKKMRQSFKNRPRKGRNIYMYESSSNAFYIDNKFKITSQITNRFVVFNKVRITSKERNLTFDITEDDIFGVCIETLEKNLLNAMDSSAPVNIFTTDPIVAELCVFIFTTFLNKNKLFIKEIGKNFVPNCNLRPRPYCVDMQVLVHTFQDKSLEEIYRIKPGEYYQYKTRNCILPLRGSHPDDDIDDDDDNDDSDKTRRNTFYNFYNENVIILDNNYNKNQKIILNIPKNAIHKSFFNPIVDKNIPHFVNTDSFFYKSLPKALNYFAVRNE